MNKETLKVENLTKSFKRGNQDKLHVLDGISFKAEKGEFLSILGPSGCGKTTLLKIIMGLLNYDNGIVVRDSKKISSPDFDRAMIFQDINLLPWRTVAQNISFGLEIKNPNLKKASGKIDSSLELVGLSDYKNYYPSQLSGGMKQRVGIARALVVEPTLLLLDEPFGLLDALTSEELQVEIMRILKNTNQTVILVTHNIEEALFLGDRVIILSDKPSQIKEEIKIKFDQRKDDPKIKMTAQFMEYKKQIWELLSKLGNSNG